MQTTIGFDIEQKLKDFEASLLSSPEITPRDRQDLAIHLNDVYDDYKAKGLDNEDAFLLALNQMGDERDWTKDFKNANANIIQVKRAVGFLGGIFFYFLLYSLILVIDKSLLYLGGKLQLDTLILYHFSKYFFTTIYMLTVLVIIILAMREEWFLKYIGKVHLRPKKIILLFIITMVLFALERILFAKIKGLLIVDINSYVNIRQTIVWFEYLFPLIFSGGFLVIYWRYFKVTKQEPENRK